MVLSVWLEGLQSIGSLEANLPSVQYDREGMGVPSGTQCVFWHISSVNVCGHRAKSV